MENKKEFIKPMIQFTVILLIGCSIISGAAKMATMIKPPTTIIPDQKITIDCKLERPSYHNYVVKDCLDDEGKNCYTFPISCYDDTCGVDYYQLNNSNIVVNYLKDLCKNN